jgi:hypothetical protein
MAEMRELAGNGSHPGLTGSLLAFALRPAPPQFTLATFGIRLQQHLVTYGALLASATYACAFVFAPLETSVISVVVIALAIGVAFLFSPSRQRVRRLVEGGIAASYIVGAAVLLKAFDALFRM